MKSIKFAPELTEQQMVNLKTLENGDWPGRVRKRAEAILLSVRGYTIDEIGAITGFHRNTVSRWLDQWAERGVDGILEREGRGRKHSLSEDEERQVMEWIEENPRSANQAVGRIEESLGKIVSPDTVRRLLKRKGKVWKRMRASLADRRDEEEFRQCQQELAEHIEAAAAGEIDLHYLDESGFGRTPYIPYGWQDKGACTALPCRDGARINVLGLYSLVEGELRSEMSTGKMTACKVARFLDEFAETVKKMTVVVIDNASIHTAKAITEKLDDWAGKGLHLYFLPTYSPELNLIEIVWRKVKYEWIHRSAYTSFESLWDSLSHIFSEIGRTYNINFA